MSHLSAIFPNETYLNGLREADATVVDALYNEFRQPISKAVEAAGGNYADGNTFFRVAVIQTGRVIASDKYPSDAPIYLYLKNLAIAQYQDWLSEKGQELPPIPAPSEEEIPIINVLPDKAEMREVRKQIRAKRQFARLSSEDQKQILFLARHLAERETGLHSVESATNNASIQRFKILLDEQEKTEENTLPNTVVTALTDKHFNQMWSACEALELRISSDQIPLGRNTVENKTILYAFLSLVVLTLGYAAYTWAFRDRTPAEVYENNFSPPASILEDMATRYAKDSIAPNRPEACTIAFSEADAYYKKREWRDAAGALAAMMDDSLEICQSDALFYLAIVGLQLERPQLTLECISKIEDLERFGEDIYWYMALAYVKIAAQDPSQKDIARRAVERALSNTEIPERRTQAEKMLGELSE